MLSLFRKNKEFDILHVVIDEGECSSTKSIKEKLLAEISKLHENKKIDIVDMALLPTQQQKIVYSVGIAIG